MIKQSVVDTTSADATFSCPHGCGAVIFEDENEKLFSSHLMFIMWLVSEFFTAQQCVIK